MGYIDDSILPNVTDESLEKALRTTRTYTIVVLKASENYSAPDLDRDPDVEKTIWRHGKRNFALREAGLMPIICPVSDGSDVTGIAIFDASAEDVDLIMTQDPGVQAGIFTYDIHPTRSFPGSTLP